MDMLENFEAFSHDGSLFSLLGYGGIAVAVIIAMTFYTTRVLTALKDLLK